MTRPFRFALQARVLNDHETVVATANRAESLGYAELYSYDHIGAVDPFVPLVVAAGATATLRVGSLVLNNELHHPALLARTAATVDRLTGGRLVLGIGAGYAQAEHDAIGLPLRAPGPRVARLEESLVAIRALLDDGAVTMAGEHLTLAIDDLGVRPLQAHVPVLIGGHGRRMVELAASHADIFQFTGLTHGPGGTIRPGGFDLAAVAERAEWLADGSGDRADDIERSILVQHTDVGDNAAGHVEELAGRFDLSPETLRESPFVLVGSVPEVIDKLEGLRAQLGVSHVVVRDAEGFAPIVAALSGR